MKHDSMEPPVWGDGSAMEGHRFPLFPCVFARWIRSSIGSGEVFAEKKMYFFPQLVDSLGQ